jgi:5,10-methenyltetrahydromethanopterin hydrogenase
MTVTVTAVYATVDTVRNAFDDLVSTGIDREKVFADEDNKQVKVMIPESAVNEVKEILNRHRPTELR